MFVKSLHFLSLQQPHHIQFYDQQINAAVICTLYGKNSEG
jgi:hypothetical protein